MIKKDNFFKNFFISSKIYNQNIKKTKNTFFSFKEDFKNGEIPFLESYTKDYLNFQIKYCKSILSTKILLFLAWVDQF